MDALELMRKRFSVRSYLDRSISTEHLEALRREVELCNAESGLHIQLCLKQDKVFDSFLAHYGNFKNARNYIALVGRKGPKLLEDCGYYGERLVLLMTGLGLGSCWIAGTYKKKACELEISENEKLVCIISFGYHESAYKAHRSRSIEQLSSTDSEVPDWFRRGMEAAILAPTAMNQQKFRISLTGGKLGIRAGAGFNTKLDLGIVKYHFELASGHKFEG